MDEGGPADSYTDRSLYDRCITRGMPGSMMPAIYGNAYEITQAPGYVAIRYEMIHETRVDPARRRARTLGDLAAALWATRAATGRATRWSSRPPTSTLRTRLPNGSPAEAARWSSGSRRWRPNTIEWSVTVERPRHVGRGRGRSRMTLTEDPEQPLFEYACHEGNYAMRNILSAARARRKRPPRRLSSRSRRDRPARDSVTRLRVRRLPRTLCVVAVGAGTHAAAAVFRRALRAAGSSDRDGRHGRRVLSLHLAVASSKVPDGDRFPAWRRRREVTAGRIGGQSSSSSRRANPTSPSRWPTWRRTAWAVGRRSRTSGRCRCAPSPCCIPATRTWSSAATAASASVAGLKEQGGLDRVRHGAVRRCSPSGCSGRRRDSTPARDIRPHNLSVSQAVDSAMKDGKLDASFWNGGVPTAADAGPAALAGHDSRQ